MPPHPSRGCGPRLNEPTRAKRERAMTRTTCPACGATRPAWVTECGKCEAKGDE